jgi:protein-L-isoaspartate O-methyltransferase
MKKKFQKIKETYDNFHREMLSNGKLMLKDTGIGYWGISPTTELFELFEKTELKKHKKFIDLGSGDGRATAIASLFTTAHGIEFDKELHEYAKQLTKKAGVNPIFKNSDFLEYPIKSYDYIFINPDNHIASKLEKKLIEEMNKKAKLVVYGPLYHPKQMQKMKTIDIQGTLVSVFQKE